MQARDLRDDAGFRTEDATEHALWRLDDAQRIGQIGDWEFDLATEAISWSPQVFEILGRDPRLGPPRNYIENAAAYDAPSVALMAAKIEAAIATGEAQEYELLVERPDGVRVPVRARAVPRKDSAGHVVSLYGTVQDITELKRAERLILESEARLGFALEAAEIGDWDMNLRTNVARRSLRHDQCFGYQEMVPEWGYDTFLAHVLPADRDRVDSAYRHAMAGHGEYDVEYRAPWPDGSVHWLWSKGRFYFDETAQPYRVAGIVADISERNHTREAANQLAAIVESSEDAIIGTDLTGIVTSWNPGAEKLFGYASAEMVGQPVKRLVPLARREEAQIPARVAGGETVPHFETVWDRKDGRSVDVAVKVSAIRDALGTIAGASCHVRDVMERRRAEAAQTESDVRYRALSEDLRVAEVADQIKSAFLATMSHELRTPLNSIIGFTGIILKGLAGPLTPEQTKQLGMVSGSARHLLDLINDILDISKIEAGQLDVRHEPFDLLRSVEQVTGLVMPLAEGRSLALEIEAPSSLPTMVGDQRRVEQILLNLLNNAIKFTNHGRITVRISLPRPGTAVRIEVADTGIGIKEADLTQLFQPFRQLDSGRGRQHEGTGLGLAICRRLTELLGGSIEAHSRWGQGSSFIVILPLESDAA